MLHDDGWRLGWRHGPPMAPRVVWCSERYESRHVRYGTRPRRCVRRDAARRHEAALACAVVRQIRVVTQAKAARQPAGPHRPRRGPKAPMAVAPRDGWCSRGTDSECVAVAPRAQDQVRVSLRLPLARLPPRHGMACGKPDGSGSQAARPGASELTEAANSLDANQPTTLMLSSQLP